MPNDIFLRKVYFFLKPILPKKVRLYLRRKHISWKRSSYADIWPIDPQTKRPPNGWTGWPEGKQFALVLTHDVETKVGQEKCIPLANLEESLGFRSSFNFIAEQYKISHDCQAYLKGKGFEIGLHGLIHNGTPFKSRRIFEKQAAKINRYLKEWNASGFRCPSMYHNLEWIGELDVEYDSSTFDTDPFEPQPDGMGTIFPFWVQGRSGDRGYLELPYTLPQDHTLFMVMEEKMIDIWKRKLDWIAEKGGMALLISHPDYMNFNHGMPTPEEYPSQFYEEFLKYIRTKYDGQYWHVLPRDLARYWSENHKDMIQGEKQAACMVKPPVVIPKRHKLRVAMLSYSFYDVDARVARYAEALVRRGDHVDVIALGQPGQPAYSLTNGVHVFRIQRRKRNEKGKVAFLSRILRFFFNSSRFLERKHRRSPYDLIHVHSVPDFEVFAAWLPKLNGAKIILDIHDIVPEFYAAKFKTGKNSFLYKMLVLIEKMSVAFSDHVIISNHLWAKTLHRSVNEGKCSVFINYPDPLIFFKRPPKKTSGKFIMMYPGTLNWHQGLDIAIEAFAKIKDWAPDAEFHIYGQGESKEFLVRLALDLGLKDRVIFHDMIPKEQIAEVMANADLGVVPKRNDSFGGEAFSTKILEFMALGVPILVSATKIDQYYFNDSVVQFSNPEDQNDLAEKILLLIKNREIRERLAENALNFASSYSWDKKKQEYFDLVDSLIRKGKNHLGSFCKSDVV